MRKNEVKTYIRLEAENRRLRKEIVDLRKRIAEDILAYKDIVKEYKELIAKDYERKENHGDINKQREMEDKRDN